MEAKESFRRSDTAIVPTGTLHAHGPTPISVDASIAERLADEVGKRTGFVTLPVVAYGEDEKMALYPGTIAISPDTMEKVYIDICRSLHRNGIRKVIFINGHGGNREVLVRAGRNAREFGVLTAIVEWWTVTKNLWPELCPPSRYDSITELAIAVAVYGKDLIDLRGGGYKGEWGEDPSYFEKIFGDKIQPRGFNNFTYKGGAITIPVDAWEIDVNSPPDVSTSELENLNKRGQELIRRVADYLAEFAKDFERIDVSNIPKSSD